MVSSVSQWERSPISFFATGSRADKVPLAMARATSPDRAMADGDELLVLVDEDDDDRSMLLFVKRVSSNSAF